MVGNYCADYFQSLTEGDLRPILFENFNDTEDFKEQTAQNTDGKQERVNL